MPKHHSFASRIEKPEHSPNRNTLRKGRSRVHAEPPMDDSIHALCSDARLVALRPMFDASKIPADSRNILDSFDKIVQGVYPLTGKQFLQLPDDIRSLSHELTDERSTRRIGYMSSRPLLSAYARYFAWWNAVRLTRLFADAEGCAISIPAEDDAVCLDIGSGPLTLVNALWLARPDLRNRRLTWYCLDISQRALALGEDIYLSIAAKAPPSDRNAPPHWHIVRVTGGIGTPIRKKAAFISCVNMFNELLQNGARSEAQTAEQYAAALLSYAAEQAAFFIAEPGTPAYAGFLMHLRKKLIAHGFAVAAPCPHTMTCPMSADGGRGGRSRAGKWCNFAFRTNDAPARLLKLSEEAGLPKVRAAMSYLSARKAMPEAFPQEKTEATELELRITSDVIRLPEDRIGFYACSALGLTLVINAAGKKFLNGDRLTILLLSPPGRLRRDKKSGALIIHIW